MSVKNSLFLSSTVSIPVPAVDPICRIHISGYALNNYQKFNPDGYTIMCETGKYCDILRFFPNTNTIILEGNKQSHMLFTDFPQRFIPDLAKELNVSPEAAFEKSLDFFSDKTVVVHPTGLQGKVYNFMRSLQNYAPVAAAFEAVSVAKTTGTVGLQVISGAPLTFVGVTYLGGIVCSYFGSVAGNKTVGVVFNASSYLLTRPMRGVEITLNGLILKPLSNLIGVPLILNGTNEIIRGKGISVQDYAQIAWAFERAANITKQVKKLLSVIRKGE